MYTYISALIIALCLPTALFAAGMDDTTEGRYFLQHQVGANQGAYALGLGYQGARYEPSLSFGFTPAIKSGAQITQANIKNNFRILSGKDPDIQWLVGASLLINVSNKTFFTAPRRYPNKYYPPNAYFFALQTTVRHHGFFVEASIIDYFLEVAARNKHSVEYISDLYSVGIGYGQDVDFELSDISRTVRNWF